MPRANLASCADMRVCRPCTHACLYPCASIQQYPQRGALPGLLERSEEQAALQPATPAQAITACCLYMDTGSWLQARMEPADVGLLDDPAPPAGASGVFCLAARASGLLQVYAVPSLQLLAEFGGLPDGLPLLQLREPGARLAWDQLTRVVGLYITCSLAPQQAGTELSTLFAQAQQRRRLMPRRWTQRSMSCAWRALSGRPRATRSPCAASRCWWRCSGTAACSPTARLTRAPGG